jgi:hypothetical protein
LNPAQYPAALLHSGLSCCLQRFQLLLLLIHPQVLLLLYVRLLLKPSL